MSVGKTTIIDNGNHRVIVADHPDQVYLCAGRASGGEAQFLSPLLALQVAAALIVSAGVVIERQFQRQLGSP